MRTLYLKIFVALWFEQKSQEKMALTQEHRDNLSLAKQGNQYGVKLKDYAVRQAAYDAYCENIALGYSVDCFHFEQDGLSVSYKTMLKYIRENPIEFPPDKLLKAKAKSKAFFEALLIGIAAGRIEGNIRAIELIMKFKFGWRDKDNAKSEGSQNLCDIKDQFNKGAIEQKDTIQGEVITVDIND